MTSNMIGYTIASTTVSTITQIKVPRPSATLAREGLEKTKESIARNTQSRGSTIVWVAATMMPKLETSIYYSASRIRKSRPSREIHLQTTKSLRS